MTLDTKIIISAFSIFIIFNEIHAAIKNKISISYFLVKIVYIYGFFILAILFLFNKNFLDILLSIPGIVAILSLYLKEDINYDTKRIRELTINIASFSLLSYLAIKNNINNTFQIFLAISLAYNFVQYFYMLYEIKIHKIIFLITNSIGKIFKIKIKFLNIKNLKTYTPLISYKFQNYINGEYIIEASTYIHNKSFVLSHIGKGFTLELACSDAKNNLLSIYPIDI